MNDVDFAALLGEHAERHSVPGAAAGLLQHGTIVTAYHGVADVTSGDAVTAETRFAAGSLTKSMVATVVARLADSGRLALEDPVAAHVPELRSAAWAGRATLRDLMANRSGLPLRADLEFAFDAHFDTDDAALARFVEEVAAAEPAGPFWSYSNVGWCVLGRVIETVSGMTWEAAMRDLLFDAVGMNATAIGASTGHTIVDGKAEQVERSVIRAYGPAGTSIVTTVTDLLGFAALHLEDPSLAALRVPHSDLSIHGWLDTWCLGWARFDWSADAAWGWDGLIGGERCALRVLPAERAAVAVMTNCSTGRAMYRSLLLDLMATEFGVTVPPLALVPSPGSAGDLSRFVGTYAWPDRRVEVAATEVGLVIERSGEEQVALPLDTRTFVVDAFDPDDPTVTFGAFDATGRPGVLYDMLWGLPRVEG